MVGNSRESVTMSCDIATRHYCEQQVHVHCFHIFYHLPSLCFTGAGGGFLILNLKECDEKLGVEINPLAREEALNERNIHLVASCSDLPDMWADVIISNHALEHVFCPWCVYLQIHSARRRCCM
jgi:hypothetical protein